MAIQLVFSSLSFRPACSRPESRRSVNSAVRSSASSAEPLSSPKIEPWFNSHARKAGMTTQGMPTQRAI